jgi:ketosteroid isomerase-like protein
MSFNRRAVTFAGVLAFAASTRSSRLFAQSNEEAAVLAAVEALSKAMLAADRAQLEALVAEPLSYGHSSGTIQTKTQFVEIIANRQTIYKSIVLTEPTTVIAGNDAIVRHAAAVEANVDGKPVSAKIGVLQVWIKQDGRWKLLARQAFKS